MKELEIILDNGFALQLFKYKEKSIVALVDDEGDFVSQTVLSETEKKSLKEIVEFLNA